MQLKELKNNYSINPRRADHKKEIKMRVEINEIEDKNKIALIKSKAGSL